MFFAKKAGAAIPPKALRFQLVNPPDGVDHWRAIVMNGGIYYHDSFKPSEVAFIEVPPSALPGLVTFSCMVYYANMTLMARKDVAWESWKEGTLYRFDWAAQMLSIV